MKIIPASLSAISAENTRLVQDRVSSVPNSNRAYVQSVISGMKKQQGLTETINYAHELQRLQWLVSANALTGDALNAVEKNKNTWQHYQSLPFKQAQLSDLANKLYKPDSERPAGVSLIMNDYSRLYGEQVLKNCIKSGAAIGIHVADEWGKNLALSQCPDEEGAHNLAVSFRQPWQQFGSRVTLKSEENSFSKGEFNIDSTLEKFFKSASTKLELANKNKPYILTSMPCPQHALLDGVSHKALLESYYRMCVLDMALLDAPHKAMIDVLNAGSHLRIRNDHGTDLEMSIVGMTFVDSRTLRNLPGSEVYSAPIKESVNGVFRSNENYAHKGQVMQGLYIEFKDGRIINYKAEKGHELLAGIIEKDEGSHYLGEIGFGTNFMAPDYQPSLNIMGEKRPGVHIAIGRSYTDKIYNGIPVNIDNGNVSKGPHKDLTLNMLGAKGDICVDGRFIMHKGVYVLPGTEILNMR